MQQHIIDDLGEIDDVAARLARASQHNLYVDVGSDYESGCESPAQPELYPKVAIYNERDQRVSYIASEKYHLLQHADVLHSVRDALSVTSGDIKTARINDYGERIDAMFIFDTETAEIDLVDHLDNYVPIEGEVDSDEINLGMHVVNSFDGDVKLQIKTGAFRTLCSNSMRFATHFSEQLHLEGLQSSVIVDAVTQIYSFRDELENHIYFAAEDKYELDEVPDVLASIGFGRNYIKNISQRLAMYLAFNDKRRVSRWDIYNTATNYLDEVIADKVSHEMYIRHHSRVEQLLIDDDFEATEEYDEGYVEVIQ